MSSDEMITGITELNKLGKSGGICCKVIKSKLFDDLIYGLDGDQMVVMSDECGILNISRANLEAFMNEIKQVSDEVRPMRTMAAAETLGEAMRNYRAVKNLARRELGQVIGISDAKICEIENKNQFSPKTAKLVADALGEDFKRFAVPVPCTICGKPFYPGNYTEVCCDNWDCKNERYKAKNRENGIKQKNKKANGSNDIVNDLVMTRRERNHGIKKTSIGEFMQECKSQGMSYREGQEAYLLAIQKNQKLGDTI